MIPSRKFWKHLVSGLKIVGGLEVYVEKNILTNQNHKCVAYESRVTHLLPIDIIINPPKKFLFKVSSATQNDCGIVVGFDNLSPLNIDEY
jgi:hypothetical protein